MNSLVILITGASHTGKTYYSQKLLEKYKYPYLSIDHLKMGLIRSGKTDLTPLSDDNHLTQYLWPVVREIIKTTIENQQNIIVEGCYVPIDWAGDFEKKHLDNIDFRCLVMTEKYIRNNFDDIVNKANIIEGRLYDDITPESLLDDNRHYCEYAKIYSSNIIMIDNEYDLPI